MKLIYHRLAVWDVREVLDFYEGEAGSALADRFFENLMSIIGKLRENPRHFPPVGETGLRRANLADFPFHVLYQEQSWGIKVMVVRHHRRKPEYGMLRK